MKFFILGKKIFLFFFQLYITKVGIFRLKKYVKKHDHLKIIIGAENSKLEDWVSTQQSFLDMILNQDWQKYFEKDTISLLLAEHVWEHLTPEDAILSIKNCFKYLKPGGKIRIAVPDGFHPDPSYIEQVKVNGSGWGADDHKVLYNYRTLSDLLESAGFQVCLLEYFDEQGEFHFQSWDPIEGYIFRSSQNDSRNSNGKLNYTSLIIDGIKGN